MKVTATLKGRPDEHKRRTIYIRINDGEKRTFEATKMRVTKAQFKKGKVIDHPHAAEFNQIIKKKIAEKELTYGSDNAEVIKDVSFNLYCLNAISAWEKRKEKEASTLKQCMGELSKIKKFRGDFKLSALNKKFLEDYYEYCINKLGNKETTAWKTFKFLRMICAKAVRERMMKSDPFKVFKMPSYEDPERIFLTKEQLAKIEQAELSDELRFIANWFLLCSYTALRFGDATVFDKHKHIKSGRLIIYTGKTGEVVSMQIADKVRKLLEAVKYKPMPFTNQYCNRALLAIKKKAGLKDKFSWHASRHSFGVMCAAAGISIEVTAKLMGHRDIKTTEIYYKIANPRIDAELGKLFV